jgi:hypothetical protein
MRLESSKCASSPLGCTILTPRGSRPRSPTSIIPRPPRASSTNFYRAFVQGGCRRCIFYRFSSQVPVTPRCWRGAPPTFPHREAGPYRCPSVSHTDRSATLARGEVGSREATRFTVWWVQWNLFWDVLLWWDDSRWNDTNWLFGKVYKIIYVFVWLTEWNSTWWFNQLLKRCY